MNVAVVTLLSSGLRAISGRFHECTRLLTRFARPSGLTEERFKKRREDPFRATQIVFASGFRWGEKKQRTQSVRLYNRSPENVSGYVADMFLRDVIRTVRDTKRFRPPPSEYNYFVFTATDIFT